MQLRIQCLSLLKKLYLPQLNAANIEQSPIFTWLPIVCYLQGISHALDHSLYAFCVIQVAITKSATISVDDALQIYYDSLRTLQVELDDKKAAQKDEILAAISVLSTCEVLLYSQPFMFMATDETSYLFALQTMPGKLTLME